MTENEMIVSAPHDPVALVRKELDMANVLYENVFLRREEVVVVLPGRGENRDAAKAAISNVNLQGRNYVSIMAHSGAPEGLKAVLAALIIIVGLIGALLMVWGYVGEGFARDEGSTPESPTQREVVGR